MLDRFSVSIFCRILKFVMLSLLRIEGSRIGWIGYPAQAQWILYSKQPTERSV
jgi:hypothetical protein